MKKKIGTLLLLLVVFMLVPETVHAEKYYGEKGWQATFTQDKKMESNFKSSDMDDLIYGLQPGDSAIINIVLKNENETATDWYMSNEVLHSLEDRSTNNKTSGGAYSYVLTYTNKDGIAVDLYNSNTVGGEDVSAAGEGLHEATNALKDFFYLDTMEQGQTSSIRLEVALDGETQNNDYQNTLADIQLSFAVELNENKVIPNIVEQLKEEGYEFTGVVKTGDETAIMPYITLAFVSGLALLVLSVWGRKERKKQQGEGM